jgi:hypothetical protein
MNYGAERGMRELNWFTPKLRVVQIARPGGLVDYHSE